MQKTGWVESEGLMDEAHRLGDNLNALTLHLRSCPNYQLPVPTTEFRWAEKPGLSVSTALSSKAEQQSMDGMEGQRRR